MEIDSPNSIGISTGFGIPTGGTAGQMLIKDSSTNYNTSWSTVITDNGSSGYTDIGNVRYQWGEAPTGASSGRVITLPAAFRNTSYSFTANAISSDNSSRTINLDTRTTTSILVRVTSGGSASGAGFLWIAIGLKPL